MFGPCDRVLVTAMLRVCSIRPPVRVRSRHSGLAARLYSGCCHHILEGFPVNSECDPVWEVDAARLKFGRGSLNEVGLDAKALSLARVAVFTDRGLCEYPHVDTVLRSLRGAGVDAVVYDEVSVEPTSSSWKHAIQFATEGDFDGFVSVGGGSVIDTAKAANLYATHPPEHFLDYVNAPIGKGIAPPGPLKPHIACPTTSGTGSECTGIAIFDLLEMHAKTGIASRQLKPTLAIVDPLTTLTLPSTVVACSGFDVLSHAAESLTARPYTKRPKEKSTLLRPMSQGSNPYSDIGCQEALSLCGRYLSRAVHDPADTEAREMMMFASTLAGLAFGNVGCHMPHALSYSVSGMVKQFQPQGYPKPEAETGLGGIIPHGMAVILNSPSVFRFTADACPQRHLRAAECLGADVRGAGATDAGEVLANRILEMMRDVSFPAGLRHVGYDEGDIEGLTEVAMPQQRLLQNAPKPCTHQDVAAIFSNAMTYW